MNAAVREPVLDTRDLRKTYRAAGGRRAVALDGVSLAVQAGEAVGLVGESGGGKSTFARVALRLVEPDAGEIWLRRSAAGAPLPLHALRGAELREARRAAQIVFQDPDASLDPRQTARAAVEEALEAAGAAAGDARARAAADWLDRVGLPASVGARRPRELSGGEKQRVAIARALAVEPRVCLLDEATTALDVSVRAGVLQLLDRLRRELGLAMVWITHDLDVVQAVAERVAVLYLGRIVEEIPAAALARGEAIHPYTRALLEAHGRASSSRSAGVPAPASDARAIPGGCRYHPCCPIAELPRCAVDDPALEPAGDALDHRVACPIALRAMGA